ncbi:NADP-dependent malic enzyme [Ehrlichia ruminantium]|uniref:NADP-dependent malic enzyme n=1 Tax=Ehrlichia ruminantium (strain Welgevonden) TaxID=254945 RepID=A0A0H3M539_EHRRW|nr:NADP-dependent malic enzyme [Ehrlichia ruminantium]QLK54793.1 NADP-dependent malic enzyme [Ehrlichia ruminantium]QLK55711.1 NADP-dependent malic enzyme [Ehrlichia ruminantium]UOD99814.1 NADP-dependent malic enzyme [Ehrlichia ruminantium]CAH57835.1 NADP-dependent malic enzyme [Ehrlichia ruminantium str. Welgevonden]CAI26611.1 NADP-dependent malic enzyme [Ehrlichia ruminantium str. Welgevonden]
MGDLENNGFDAKKREALEFHCKGLKPGKVSLMPTKPLLTQRDLSLAYSPGVAVPCLEIAENPDLVYKYTARGNYVAVISNGTAVLGLGNIGPLASKPVMEGKAVLFKRFADIDAIDLEVDTSDVDEFVNAIKYLGLSWGGINLEDIRAPECFIIEEKLSKIMDIPVFHDDQHGTAIIVSAGLINALDITGKNIKDIKIVVNGAGAAGIACLEMIKLIGVPAENITLCDQNGVIYKDRQLGMNEWKAKHAIDTKNRSLKDALVMADVFLGLSVKDVLSENMLLSMNKDPIIFALANPDPEINPDIARKIRPDAIIATGRSDYNNQINNVMGFPYIFRGALDVQARCVNSAMKVAAANAIAMLAREYVSDEVSDAYGGRKMNYGKDYIIPTPFDPRLITVVAPAVAKSAIESGVARRNIENWDEYVKQLESRLSSTSNVLNMMYSSVKRDPKKVIFSEGEEEKIIQAAVQWRNQGYGVPILVGRIDKVHEGFERLGIKDMKGIEIANAAISENNNKYTDYLYKQLQREGYLYRSCVRDVKTDRNVFAACMLACGDGDILITGLTRGYTVSIHDVQKVIKPKGVMFGLSIIVMKERTIFIADTAIHESPTPEQVAEIAIQASMQARKMGHEPRVAFISSSNFGSHSQKDARRMRKAIEILDNCNVNFEYDGEMSIDVALNPELLTLYPFCRLTSSANVLIMPTLHSASISSKLLREATGVPVIGPILVGMEKPVQIVQMSSSVSEILNLTVLAPSINN